MGQNSGVGREIRGTTAHAARRNLVEFRGSIWEAVTDWFFGVTTVDYDWRETADKDRVTKWIYTQDGVAVSDHNVTVGKNELDIGLTAGPDPLSNQRDLFTIPETGSWGIAHAIVEVKSEAYSGALGILPQHGFGLRAQEDTKRRTIAVWHDVFVGNPHVINVGVWHGNLDGTGFDNRGGSATFDLKQTFNITAGTRSGGTVTATCTSHGLVVDDWINVAWTREFASVAVSRASNVVTATPGSGHGFQAGDVLAVGLSSPASFDGTFTITSVNATQVFWNQTGSNESGTGKLKDQASDVTQVQVTEIPDANTFKYVDGKHDLTSLGVSNGNNARNFPYWMEVKVSGTVVWVRCWSRHQSVPSWTQPNNAFNCDLEKAHTNYTVTASSRTSNIATLTIGAHDFAIGNRIDVDITDASFDTTNGFVTDFNATQVMYANTGVNDGDGGTGTCELQGGSALASQIIDIPTPRGSGRIALVANHEGIIAKSHVSYGDITGTNSFESVISSAALVVEAETAQPAGRAKTGTVGFADEAETPQAVTAAKTMAAGQPAETETGAVATPVKVLGAAQVVETETATVTGHSKLRSVGQPSETETAATTTVVKAATVQQSSETETAASAGRLKALTTSEATEAESGSAVTATKQLAAGQPVEVETATAPARLKSQVVVQVLETETAQVVTFTSGLSVGQPIETESGQPFQVAKTATAGLVSDLETAGAVSPAKVLSVGQPLEDESAQVVTVSDTTVAGQSVEAEIAAQLQAVKTLATGVAVDVEAAGAVTSVKALAVAQTVEAETATVATVVRLRALAQAVELDAGLAFASLKRLTLLQPSEVETGTEVGRPLPDPNPAHVNHTSGRSTVHATDNHVVAASGPSSTVTYQEGQ